MLRAAAFGELGSRGTVPVDGTPRIGRMTKLSRRQFLPLAGGAAVLPAVSQMARAQTYPERPVRIIVGFPAGGQIDIIARLIGQWLSERLGQQFFIDNRPGAASNIAAEALIRAPADGYTLFLANGTNAVNATLYDNLRFDFVRDTAPIASVNRIPLVLYVHPSFPAKTVAEVITYAKTNPGKLSIATPPKGTGPAMAAELFKLRAGIDVVVVRYRADAQVVTDLLGGQVQVAFGGISPVLPHVRAGKLRALGVAGAARSAELPDIPPIGDTLPGFEASGWCGLVAPRNIPVRIVEKLHDEINAGLADPNISARLADAGVTTLALSQADFGKFVVNETEKWAKVIHAANLHPD
jgi:tripartite-type tricarboxylate transporter receptor subunit TctC